MEKKNCSLTKRQRCRRLQHGSRGANDKRQHGVVRIDDELDGGNNFIDHRNGQTASESVSRASSWPRNSVGANCGGCVCVCGGDKTKKHCCKKFNLVHYYVYS